LEKKEQFELQPLKGYQKQETVFETYKVKCAHHILNTLVQLHFKHKTAFRILLETEQITVTDALFLNKEQQYAQERQEEFDTYLTQLSTETDYQSLEDHEKQILCHYLRSLFEKQEAKFTHFIEWKFSKNQSPSEAEKDNGQSTSNSTNSATLFASPYSSSEMSEFHAACNVSFHRK